MQWLISRLLMTSQQREEHMRWVGFTYIKKLEKKSSDAIGREIDKIMVERKFVKLYRVYTRY